MSATDDTATTADEQRTEIRSVGGRVLFVSRASSVRAALVEAVAARADLYGADLGGADLGGANLYGADLGGADLGGANLYGANLYGAKNAELAIAQTRILPEGNIIGWKKARGDRIVKLEIPADARRSHAAGRKCRAERAVVLAIYDGDTEATEAFSWHNAKFRYTVGETVTPTSPFDDDPWNECAAGIHFYITREEAVAHV